MNIIKKRLAQSEREGGFALALVLSIGLVLILLVVTATTVSVSGLKTARSDEDASAALDAAYAGIDEYESRLAGDSSYGQYGNVASQFTSGTGSKVISPAPSSPNPAFDVTKGGTWATVAGSGGTASFRYEVDNSKFASDGILRLRSTGKVGNTTRSVVATLKGKGFIDFLYFTDYEIGDPSLGPFQPGTNIPLCQAQYGYDNPNRSSCTEITFANGDKLDGPVHSNDVMHICNATFTGAVTSADPVSPFYSPTTGVTYPAKKSNGQPGTLPSHSSCTGQNWAKDSSGNKEVPTQDTSIVMPTTNTDQLKETRIDQPIDVPRPGCLYTGPTKITFTSDGNMRVVSPYTKYTQSGPEGTPAPGVTLASCGTPGPNGLGSTAGQVVPVPNNNLIYVQGVPADPNDPNYTASTAVPAAPYPGCWGSNLQTTGSASSTNEPRVAGNGIGFPTSVSTTSKGKTSTVNEAPPSDTAYGCTSGDVFVQGTLKGRLTISAANYVYITGDTTYADTDGDILGLVGQKAVWVWNPILDNSAKTLVLPPGNRTIDAAILSLNDTFVVQNYDVSDPNSPTKNGSRGSLVIKGAIAQKFRGAVATTGPTGYIKNYSYDKQLQTAAPPKFLAPVSTTYGTTSIAPVGAGFTADGSAVPLG
jgi:hypothetical protein